MDYNLSPPEPDEQRPQAYPPVINGLPRAAPGLMPSPEAIAATTPTPIPGPISSVMTAGPVDAMQPRPTGPTPAPDYTATADPSFPNMYGNTQGVADSGNYGGSMGRVINRVFSAPGGAVSNAAAETVAPSAQTPRGPISSVDQYPDQNSRAAASGGRPALQTGYQYQSGPISGAAAQGPAVEDYGPGRSATVYPPDQNVDTARLRQIQNGNITGAIEAQSQRQVQERNAMQIAQANAANAGQDAQRAAGEARVANFRATNGADVVLAGGNQAYNSQRQGIINGARSATEQSLIANKTANEANIIAGQPVGNPIQDQAATTDTMLHGEEAINRRGQINRANSTADIQNQLGQQQVEHGKATASLLAKLSDATLSPKERQAAQQSYLVSLGKDPAQYKVEHSNGPPVLDSLGQLHPGPQYVHIVNTTTGEVQTMKNQPDTAAKPYAGPDEAHADAKKALAAGMKLDEVNKRLQAAGYPPLQ